MFKGSCVALVTPFKNGRVDESKLRELVDFHVKAGTSAIVPCGSTGESATLSHAEHIRVVEVVVRASRGRIPVIAGTGSNSTTETVSLTRRAKAAGADAALVIVPYYNKPSQEGMVQHFTAVAQAVSLPLFIYNIPSRTGVNLLPATLARIAAANRNIAGVKESSGNLEQISEVAHLFASRKDFTLLSGDDSLTLPVLAVGGRGVISVLANIAPKDVQELCTSALGGDWAKARRLASKAFPLVRALFVETNPAPVKTAMEHLKLCSGEMRLPMCQ